LAFAGGLASHRQRGEFADVVKLVFGDHRISIFKAYRHDFFKA
jgi:hypothetical protein